MHLRGRFGAGGGGALAWVSGGLDSNYMSIGSPSGRWIRFGNTVLFYLCMSVELEHEIVELERADLFMAPPTGTSKIHSTHGLGNQITNNAGWYPIEITSGRWQSNRDSAGTLTGDGASNAVLIRLQEHLTTGIGDGALIAIHGIYNIQSN